MSGTGLAGVLTERVFLLLHNPARDDLGGAIGGWTTQASLWAAITPDGAATADDGDRRSTPHRWRAILRSGVQITAGDRLQWKGLLMDVLRVETDPARRDRITLRLEEVR
jgi:head-tail adaptor